MRSRHAWKLAALLPPLAGCGEDNPVGPGPDPGAGAQLNLVTFQAASVVIGQTDMEFRAPNAGGTTGAVGLSAPSGAGAGALFVPDTGNHRVLGFSGLPTTNGPAATFVLGQPDFVTTLPGVTSGGLTFPMDCTVADGKLAVADFSNSRVLIWSSVPTSGVPADVVVGQADFNSRVVASTRTGLSDPVRIAMGGGKLVVSDHENNRVLIWSTVPTTNGAPASVVVGQPDFTSNGRGLSASRLSSPAAVWTDGTRLVVGDADNHRVLIWSAMPTTNGAPADLVLGAADFDTPGPSAPSARTVQVPVGIASDGVSLFVADQALHRVLIFSPFPTANNEAAVAVLGQGDFASATDNDDDQDGTSDSRPTSRTLSGPRAVNVLDGRLFVTDEGNHRVLVYESAPPFQ